MIEGRKRLRYKRRKELEADGFYEGYRPGMRSLRGIRKQGAE